LNTHFILQWLSKRGKKTLFTAPRLLGIIIVAVSLSACLSAAPSAPKNDIPSPVPPEGVQQNAPILPVSTTPETILPPTTQSAPDVAQASIGFNVSGWT